MQILKREPSNLPMYEQQTKINNKRAKKKLSFIIHVLLLLIDLNMFLVTVSSITLKIQSKNYFIPLKFIFVVYFVMKEAMWSTN